MAAILDVKRTVEGGQNPVLDRNTWIQSLVEDPSELQLQKWIFVWMYVRSNFKKMVTTLKHPDEIFEEKFMSQNGLQYIPESLQKMKKNNKTCIRLLYNLRARCWKEQMIAQIKDKLMLTISITAPVEIRGGEKNYRRNPNSFFLGKTINGKHVWTEVQRYT